MTIAYVWRQQQLGKALESFNAAVGAWEHRVVPGARKLKELGAASPEQELRDIDPVERSLRKIPNSSMTNAE